MNKSLEEFARHELKQRLQKCTLKELHLFNQMYSHKNLNADIDTAVDNMPSIQLDWALTQVENTLKKKDRE